MKPNLQICQKKMKKTKNSFERKTYSSNLEEEKERRWPMGLVGVGVGAGE